MQCLKIHICVLFANYRESISLGETDLPEDAVTKVIDCLGKKYPGDEYHLIRKNCNHFAQEFVQVCLCIACFQRTWGKNLVNSA